MRLHYGICECQISLKYMVWSSGVVTNSRTRLSYSDYRSCHDPFGSLLFKSQYVDDRERHVSIHYLTGKI